MEKREDLRNIAIIAHVDHGKTTLVDAMLKQSGVFRENEQVKDRIMDSGDIERERGITILSKNTSIRYKNTKINIIDTPGHADFGGEVERVLKMVDGVLLLVDAFEGPMPQTKFVLKKAFDLNLKVIVLINKIDRPDARPEEVINEVLDLFIELGAGEDALDAPFVFTSGKRGLASLDEKLGDSMEILFKTIIENIPAPTGEENKPLQLLISSIDYNDYVGKIGIGKIERGRIFKNENVLLLNREKPDMQRKVKIANLYEFDGLDRVEIEEAKFGAIVAVSGIDDINIGDTICDEQMPEALEFVKISQPTIAMNFSVNDSPFAGTEGKFITTRQIRNRLFKELQTDVSLRVEETMSTDSFKVSGRGELHLGVLIENMRREGFEFQVSKPEVLFDEKDGKLTEPMEKVFVDVSNEYLGSVIDKLGRRRGELLAITEPIGGYAKAEFLIPARGLIGYRQEFLTDTKGEGILNTEFAGYDYYKGDIPSRIDGSIISFDSGVATAYGLNNAQERGQLFIEPGTKVYEGMVIGSSAKGLDVEVSVTKEKKLSNVRASGSDDAIRLVPPIKMSLEEALDFIEEDELIEVTPESIRIRKNILNNQKRHKAKKKN
ncbi:MAG: translational GTPase TypA [Tissierellia bacterium]|nr:translational GTPase TypA [Tissierellia bacterium]